MKGKWGRCWVVLGLLLMLLLPRSAQAGPFFGDWGWCWHPAKDCAPSLYSPWHYWAPTVYRYHAYCKPANLDSYAPGVPVPITFMYLGFKCRSIAPAPTPPYADPSGFYGVPLVPPNAAKSRREAGTGRAEPSGPGAAPFPTPPVRPGPLEPLVEPRGSPYPAFPVRPETSAAPLPGLTIEIVPE